MRILLLALSFIPLICQAYEAKSHLYEKDSDRKTLLYDWKRTESIQGKTVRMKGVYTAPDKSVPVIEEAVVTDGKLESYKIHHHQLGQEGEVQVKDGKLLFTYTKNGKTETSTEDWQENFAVAPTLVDHLIRHREELLKGDTIKVRYGVLDRLETVGFSFFKTGEKKVGGVDATIVKMKPSSFLIAALVDPLYFTLDTKTFKLLELLGRTLPKRAVGSEFKDLDCEIVYY